METMPIKQDLFRLNQKSRQSIILLISLCCVFLFLSSAYTKIADHERFVLGLERVSFLHGIAPLVGWLVPAAEIVISVLLIMPRTYRYGLYAFAALMAIFTLYISGMTIWADRLPCHCNLFIEQLSWGQHLVFNIVFILIPIYALWQSKK